LILDALEFGGDRRAVATERIAAARAASPIADARRLKLATTVPDK